MNNKTTYIYFLYDRKSKMVKIGYSCNIQRRIKQLQTSNPNELELVYYVEGNRDTEYFFHKRFSEYRRRGEFFESKPILDWIKWDKLQKEVMKEMGIMSV